MKIVKIEVTDLFYKPTIEFYNIQILDKVFTGIKKAPPVYVIKFSDRIPNQIDGIEFDWIISFADKEWSIGDLYFKLGFKKVSESKPNYKYLVEKKRVNKQRFKKSKLVSEGFDNSKSETEIMHDRGIYKIWDCGQIKFIYQP